MLEKLHDWVKGDDAIGYLVGEQRYILFL